MTSIDERLSLLDYTFNMDVQPVENPMRAEAEADVAATVGNVALEAPAEPVETPHVDQLPSRPRPQVDQVEALRPVKIEKSPEEILAAAVKRYGGGNSSASFQNMRGLQQARAQRVKRGFEPYSAVTQLTGGYPPGFRRS